MVTLPDLLAVARGDKPADLIIRNGRIANVFSGEFEEGDIAVLGNRIAGIGRYARAATVVDAAGATVTPGLIDAHVHIESSLCAPAQFAAAIVPRGVTAAVIDPHEIANVAGIAGIRYMTDSCRRLPLTAVVMASSCVPATPMASSGATLDADALAELCQAGTVHGLAEVMNYPGVIHADPAMLAKLITFRGRPIDGHAPGVGGRDLNAYVAAGIGSDHECTTVEEAAEKLARGLYILIREATNARNLDALLPLITPHNSRRIAFCTDDRIPHDLLATGSIDYMLRTAIAAGVDPFDALRMATLNTAEWFGLHHLGAIAPGRQADLVLVDDLSGFNVQQVFAQGRLVARDGAMLPEIPLPVLDATGVHAGVNIDWDSVDFSIVTRGDSANVIGLHENQLITDARRLPLRKRDGHIIADPERDILKLAVIERHHARGSMACGLVQGFGLKRGAIAGTVAHDHHNLIVVGADDAAMWTAARAVAEMGGGLVVAEGDTVRAALPLPIAGLMSDRPIGEVRDAYDALRHAAAQLGSPLHDPFMAMSFMGLEVIPRLKLTDQGLVDVAAFDFIDLFNGQPV